MRVEVRVSSPEPAVGGSVTPGTCQARLSPRATASVKLHGSCTREDGLDRTRPSPGSAAVGFGLGLWAGHRARSRRWCRFGCGDQGQGIGVPGVHVRPCTTRRAGPCTTRGPRPQTDGSGWLNAVRAPADGARARGTGNRGCHRARRRAGVPSPATDASGHRRTGAPPAKACCSPRGSVVVRPGRRVRRAGDSAGGCRRAGPGP